MRIIVKIMAKLVEAGKSRVEKMMDMFGRSLAVKLSEIAQGWGYENAEMWAEDRDFIRYLAVIYMSNNKLFRLGGNL